MFKENLFYKNSILKPCLSPLSLCKVLDSYWHRIHKFSYLGYWNFLPLLLDILKENFFVGSLWCLLSNSQVKNVPDMFNWVHIWWLTWPPEFLYAIFLMPSLCHFCWMLNDRRHHLPWKDGGSCWHEHWQRLVEDPPWVFWCIWQNLCNLHIPQVHAFHHAKLHPKPLQKSHHV